jgi:outer membrane protein assembly factor BamB
MKRLLALLLSLPFLTLPPPAARAADADATHWPQFRGPDGLGVAPDGMKLPTEFGPAGHVVWKADLPPGLSSPCVWGERIFLTGFDRAGKRLETLCLDRGTGTILWRRPAPAKQIERVQKVNSPAAPTPATDGRRVYVYFGSFGLLCYDLDGNEVWQRPLPTPATRYGTATSPVVADGLVLLKCQGPASSLLALDAATGKTAWEHDKLPFDVGYSPPFVWRTGGAAEVVVHGDRAVRAYDLKDGGERWSVGGLTGEAIPAPVAADGLLFVVSEFPGGDQDDRFQIPSFKEMLKKYDKNGDGKLSKDEIPADAALYRRDPNNHVGDIRLRDLFDVVDLNKDGKIDSLEWFAASALAGRLESALVAIRPGGKGDVTRSHVAWKEKKSLPEVPSPLAYRGRLYLVKNQGIVSCLEAKTGKLLYRERLGEGGFYYASPVAGDGKVYFTSESGVVTVVRDGPKFEVLARNDLGEAVRATPALAGGRLYVRTDRHLYAFGE